MFQVETERLVLLPLSADYLRLCLEKLPQLELELGIEISPDILTESVGRAMGIKLTKMALVKEWRHVWYTYWLLIVKEEQYGVGVAGFKGHPTQRGEVEIGYSIAPAYQGHGYMTEAVEVMIAWAFEMPRCTAVSAKTLKSNLASQRVLEKVGMQITNETEDSLMWRLVK